MQSDKQQISVWKTRLENYRNGLNDIQNKLCHELLRNKNNVVEMGDLIEDPDDKVRRPILMKFYEMSIQNPAMPGRKLFHFCAKLSKDPDSSWSNAALWWRTEDILVDVERFNSNYFAYNPYDQTKSRFYDQSRVPVWVEDVLKMQKEAKLNNEKISVDKYEDVGDLVSADILKKEKPVWFATSEQWPYGVIDDVRGTEVKANHITSKQHGIQVKTIELNCVSDATMKNFDWIDPERIRLCYEAIQLKTRNLVISRPTTTTQRTISASQVVVTQVTGLSDGAWALESYSIAKKLDPAQGSYDLINAYIPSDAILPQYARWKPSSVLKRTTLAQRCVSIMKFHAKDEFPELEKCDFSFEVMRHSVHVTLVSLLAKHNQNGHEFLLSYTITTFQKIGMELYPPPNDVPQRIDENDKDYVDLASSAAAIGKKDSCSLAFSAIGKKDSKPKSVVDQSQPEQVIYTGRPMYKLIGKLSNYGKKTKAATTTNSRKQIVSEIIPKLIPTESHVGIGYHESLKAIHEFISKSKTPVRHINKHTATAARCVAGLHATKNWI